MSKRFDFEDDDFQDPEFSDVEDMTDDEGEYMAMMERREAIDIMQVELVQADQDQKLLFKTIRMLERSWFWRFKSVPKKITAVTDSYNKLKLLLKPKN